MKHRLPWRLLLPQRKLLYLLATGVLLQVVINLLSSWLQAVLGETPGRIFVLIVFVGAAALAVWAFVRLLDRAAPQEIVPHEEKAPRFAGLIALVGPRGRDGDPLRQAAGVALEHHLAAAGPGEPLRVAWLVTSRGEGGAVHAAETFRALYQGRCTVHVCTVADAFDVQETFALVQRLYEQDVPAAGLEPQQVVADLTGATSIMTAGMALACRDRWPMEYVTGPPGTASAPVLVRWQPASHPTQTSAVPKDLGILPPEAR